MNSMKLEHVKESEKPNVQQNTQEDNDTGLPKVWSIEDPFQYAPPKLNEDPWTLLLEPLLKNDKLRCDAWRDEVQNLLIFAGLFSAVVTAFIVESYKNLQPDPNEAMINILAHIATRLDGQSNSTIDSFSITEPFMPDASAIRINVFWFISLVLSLTTVLVGIISLQWLREHQSYPNLSPREVYAVFNMRSEGITRWHVSRIFTAMPLLLQCALVLFLAGVIDFLHAFRQWAVVIPVSVVIGLSLLFPIATTMLPTLHTFLLYIDFTSRKNGRPSNWPVPPSQCPFKSPQSHAMHRLCRPLFKFTYRLLEQLHSPRFRHMLFRITHPFSHRPLDWHMGDNFTSYIYNSSFGWHWVDFDKSWLVIRDGYMRRALGWSIWYQYIGDVIRHHVPPLYDLTDALNTQKNQNSTVAAAYHCLSSLSEEALSPVIKANNKSFFPAPSDRLRQNNYLHDLISMHEDHCSLSEFLNLETDFYDYGKGNFTPTGTKIVSSVLHQQNLLTFTEYSESLSFHRKELLVRFFGQFYQGQHRLNPSNIKTELPRCLSFIPFDENYGFRSQDADLLDDDAFEALSWQFANLTLAIFQQFDEDFHPHLLVYNPFSQSEGLLLYMETASYIASKTLSPPIHPPTPVTQATIDKMKDVFSYINQSLGREMTTWPTEGGQPSLLFHLAAYYSYQLITFATDESFISLRETILQYKKCTIDLGKLDSVTEKRLLADYQERPYKYSTYYTQVVPFSPEWWVSFEFPEPLLQDSLYGPDVVYNIDRIATPGVL